MATVTIGNEPEEVTLSVNEVYNSFDELDKKNKQYESKWRFNGWGIQERLKLPGNELIDIWISEIDICIHGGRKFQVKGDGKRATQYSHEWFQFRQLLNI